MDLDSVIKNQSSPLPKSPINLPLIHKSSVSTNDQVNIARSKLLLHTEVKESYLDDAVHFKLQKLQTMYNHAAASAPSPSVFVDNGPILPSLVKQKSISAGKKSSPSVIICKMFFKKYF